MASPRTRRGRSRHASILQKTLLALERYRKKYTNSVEQDGIQVLACHSTYRPQISTPSITVQNSPVVKYYSVHLGTQTQPPELGHRSTRIAHPAVTEVISPGPRTGTTFASMDPLSPIDATPMSEQFRGQVNSMGIVSQNPISFQEGLNQLDGVPRLPGRGSSPHEVNAANEEEAYIPGFDPQPLQQFRRPSESSGFLPEPGSPRSIPGPRCTVPFVAYHPPMDNTGLENPIEDYVHAANRRTAEEHRTAELERERARQDAEREQTLAALEGSQANIHGDSAADHHPAEERGRTLAALEGSQGNTRRESAALNLPPEILAAQNLPARTQAADPERWRNRMVAMTDRNTPLSLLPGPRVPSTPQSRSQPITVSSGETTTSNSLIAQPIQRMPKRKPVPNSGPQTDKPLPPPPPPPHPTPECEAPLTPVPNVQPDHRPTFVYANAPPATPSSAATGDASSRPSTRDSSTASASTPAPRPRGQVAVRDLGGPSSAALSSSQIRENSGLNHYDPVVALIQGFSSWEGFRGLVTKRNYRAPNAQIYWDHQEAQEREKARKSARRGE